MRKNIFALLAAVIVAPALHAEIRITEWMYDNANGNEFIELTNLGTTSVDFTGWSFDDNSRSAGSFSLSDFGTLAAGQSAIITDMTAANFRAQWNLAASIKVAGGNTQNLGRADEINIYDASSALVDRLTYGDQSGLGPRTSAFSASTGVANLGANNAAGWTLSFVGDSVGSYSASSGGGVGSPGTYAVPEPGTYALITLGLGLVIWQMRRRTLKA